jgi:hypothetical protein
MSVSCGQDPRSLVECARRGEDLSAPPISFSQVVGVQVGAQPGGVESTFFSRREGASRTSPARRRSAPDPAHVTTDHAYGSLRAHKRRDV